MRHALFALMLPAALLLAPAAQAARHPAHVQSASTSKVHGKSHVQRASARSRAVHRRAAPATISPAS